MRPLWQTAIRLSLTAILLLLPTGCGDLREVDNLNMVLALGIDQLPSQRIRVTAELINVQQKGGQQEKSKAGQATLCRAEEGATLEQAIQNFEQHVPQQLFLPDNMWVVFGGNYAHQGVNRALDYFERERSYRRNEWFIVTGGNAQALLKADASPAAINALAVRKLVEQGVAQSITVRSEQLRFMRQFLAPSHTPLLARVDVDPKGRPTPAGVGICPQGKWMDSLNPEKSQMLTLVLGTARQMTLTLPSSGDTSKTDSADGRASSANNNSSSGSKDNSDSHASSANSNTASTGGDASSTSGESATSKDASTGKDVKTPTDVGTTVKILFSRTRIIPHLSQHGPLSFTVQVYSQAELLRLPPGSKLSPEAIKQLEAEFNRVVADRISQLLTELQARDEDAAQLGTLVYRTHPRQWQTLARNWPQVYRNSSFQVKVRFHLLRTGLIASSPDAKGSTSGFPSPLAGTEGGPH